MDEPAYYTQADCDLDAFRALTSQTLDTDQVPHATCAQNNIPVYDAATLRDALTTAKRQTLLAEWGWVLGQGPGAFAISGAYPDTTIIDAATTAYEAIIAEEKAQGAAQADHFATAGNN
ncbi:MAG: phytanoyl-CoA dioxygenase, partial [Pseudomonadota bacterium]